MSQSHAHFQKLQDIVAALRSPDGCPWDRKQTAETFKSYLIEEAHELLEALGEEDPNGVKEELGDMFFQLVFLGRLYEEQGHFTLAEALDAINKKMVDRHPHVFGEMTIETEEEQRKLWNRLKSSEKKKQSTELISNVPKSMPALRRAQRVSERAAHNGFDWKNSSDIFLKVNEELQEFQEAMAHNDPDAMQEELGDLLFAVVNLGRKTNINSEESLIRATEKFISRFSRLEKGLRDGGKHLRDTNPDELARLWQENKKSHS